MHSRFSLTIRLLSIAIAAVGAQRLSAADAETLDKLRAEKLAAVEQCYEAYKVSYEAGTCLLSEVYAASRDWKDAAYETAKTKAERIAALEKHHERMAKLHEKVHALAEVMAKGGEVDKDSATSFWELQAKIWILEELAKP